MLSSDRHRLRGLAIRKRLREIEAIDELTTEVREESVTLQAELTDVEVREAAAIASEPDKSGTVAATGDDPEQREKREVRSRTGFRDYLVAACGGAPVTGAASEFNAACGVASGDHVPRELFDAPARERRESEHRAITPGPSLDAAAMPTVPYLFEQAVITTLGLEYPTVASGLQQIPSITTAPPASVVAEGGSALATAGAYALASRSPKRLTGQIEFSVEDLAVHPALESDLSMALQESLSNTLDEDGFNGGGTAALSGLFHQATDVTASGTTDTFPLGLAAFAALVDGRYARNMGHLRGVIGSKTFAFFMSLYHGGSGDVTLFEKLRSLMGSLEVSDRMPVVASGAQKGMVTRNAGGQNIRIYTWGSLQLIRDPFSGAGSGKVVVTAVQLVSDPFIPYGVNQAVEINRDLS